jgi:hypothetical protein
LAGSKFVCSVLIAPFRKLTVSTVGGIYRVSSRSGWCDIFVVYDKHNDYSAVIVKLQKSKIFLEVESMVTTLYLLRGVNCCNVMFAV